MINLLWLFLILGVNVALLWVALKFFGKTGLFVFGTFALIQANFQATLSPIDVGGVGFFASAATWVTLLLALIVMMEKYGVKSVLSFAIIGGAAIGATLLTDMFTMFEIGLEVTFLEIFTSSLCTLLLFAIECLVIIVINELFRGVKLHKFLQLAIIFAILVIVDVILFTGVQSINIMTGEQMFNFGIANLWQKAIVFALMLPVLLLLLNTKEKDLESVLDEKVNEQPEAQKVEEEKEVKEEVAQPEEKEVEIVLEAEEKPKSKKAPAKKPATKKETAKKPVAKKTTTKTTKAKEEVKEPAKKPTAKKAATKKPATKTTAKKTTAKKTTTKKTTKKAE